MAGCIDDEVKSVIDGSYEKALALLNEHREKLDAVAEFLLKNESMTGEEFRAVMEATPAENEE